MTVYILVNIVACIFASLRLPNYAYLSVFVATNVFIYISFSILTLTPDRQTAKVTFSS